MNRKVNLRPNSKLPTCSQRPIRILHFIHSLDGGGAERQLRYLIDNLSTMHFENGICLVDDSGYEKLNNHPPVYKFEKKNQFDFQWSYILDVIREFRPDIVHNWIPYMMASSLLPSMLTSIPYISGYRSAYKLDSIDRFIHAFFYLFTSRIVSNVAPDGMNLLFRTLYLLKKGEFIPNGFDLNLIRAIPTHENLVLPTNQKSESIYILFVGRLEKVKNVSVLIEAIDILARSGANVHLLICGKGNQENALISQVKSLGLQDLIHFFGYRSDIHQIMKQCSMLVLPSTREGMPNAIFEAMANNLPVIASDIKVHRFWMTHRKNALLFSPKSADELALRIQELIISPSLRMQLITSGLETVANLSIDTMTNRFQSLYSSVIRH